MKNLLSAGIGAIALGLAGIMRGTQDAVPFMARPTPRFERSHIPTEKDGYGRRIKPKKHPRHNAFQHRYSRAHQAFADKVRSTHSNALLDDPRDDKYLHSHARWARQERAAADLRRKAS